MAEDINNQSTDQIEESNKRSEAERRITQLSEKVELTSKERDELKTLREQDQKKIQDLEKENTFNTSFVDMLSTHPQAKDHKEEIKAKVLAGYAPTDAMFAVLGAANKLGGVAPVQTQVAGGSADTTVMSAQKSVAEMTQAERRAALEKDLPPFGSQFWTSL